MATNPNIIATDQEGNELTDAQVEVNGIVPGSGGSDSDSTTDTRTDISDSGGTVVSEVTDIQVVASGDASVSVSDDGDGSATVDVSASDSHTGVSDGGSEMVADVEDIDFGAELNVADDGDDSVTVSTVDETVRTRQATIPLTEIADGNNAVGLRKQIPSGKTLRVLEVGVEDDTGSAPAGLTIEVRDLTNAVDIVSQNARHAEGSPLASKDGAIDVAFRAANATGGSVNASGYVLYTME